MKCARTMPEAASIVKHLRDKYRPAAVILHGSRAAGYARKHSDWDLFLLFLNDPQPSVDRVDIDGQDVEWQGLRWPFPENEFYRRCGVQLQFAQILWEDDSRAGTALLNLAAGFYSKGIQLAEGQKATYKQYLIHKANGMEDDIETPYLFLRHQHIFLERASNWWFEMRGEYRKPLYVAMPVIQRRDPEYFSLLLTLSSAGPNALKLHAARQLVSKLFD